MGEGQCGEGGCAEGIGNGLSVRKAAVMVVEGMAPASHARYRWDMLQVVLHIHVYNNTRNGKGKDAMSFAVTCEWK
jgi:hypothetical protein